MNKSTKYSKVLFILHMPPPVHGASMVGKYIHDSKIINNAFECHYLNLALAKDLDDIGKGGIRKLKEFYKQLKQIRKQTKLIVPQLCYVTPNAKGGAFYKDFFVVMLLKMMRQNIVVHYHNKGIATRQNRYFDNEPCEYLEINEDDIKDLCDKMKKIAIENTWNDEEKAAIRDVTKNILITWGILKEDNGKIIPTNAYALLTGKMQIQPTIQCAVFKGKTRAYFVDRREFSGPIQDQVQLAFQYVLEKINMGMQIKGIYRQDVYELPINSVRELIANAVAHRNYLEPGNIQVAIFDDRLEVTSPGMLLNTVSIKKMIEGYSRLRNPAIANAFAYMKIIEKWGTGIPRILRECKEYGLKKPELIDFDGDFRVNMYRREEKSKTTQTTTQTTTQITTQTTIKLTKNDHEILQVIQNNPALSQKEIAMELGWTVDRVKYYLNKMKKQEAIRRIGSSHKGYWELLIKL